MEWIVDDRWSKIETDYLLSLCELYNLNFHVIADRYSFGVPVPLATTDEMEEDKMNTSSRGGGGKRSIVEIKARYNVLCQRLPLYKYLADPFYDAGI